MHDTVFNLLYKVVFHVLANVGFATYTTIKINSDFALLTDSQETSLGMGHLHVAVKSSNSMHLCV